MKFRKNLPEKSSANYLKLKDKESAIGLFQGMPYEFYAVWEGGTYKEVPEGTPGASFRFKINFVVKEGATYVAKVFENGVSVYKDVANMHDDYPLDKTAIKITRNGAGKSDTTYSFLPLPPNQQPKAESLRMIREVALNEFAQRPQHKEGYTPEPAFDESPPDEAYGDELPF